MLGLHNVVGIELDRAACETRAAAGHRTIRADVSAFPVERLAGKVTGGIFSPPCVVFSAAGKRAGIAVMEIIKDAIGDAFAGYKTRAAHRREMARVLRLAWWPNAKLTRAQRSAAIRKAVLSASLVIEPARFIYAARPEWVALEQVPAVLPLWKAYARELRALGYSAWCGILNAADYGVPQTRQRAILIASRVRRVSRPSPTHYDPRKGLQLFGDPWVSMAEALGWGATERSAPTVTAGGTSTGGAEPFGHRDRDALQAEQASGQWALRIDAQARASVRDVTAPALKFGHSSADMQWVLRNNTQAKSATRSLDEPAGTLFFGHRQNDVPWILHTNRGQDEDGTRQTVDPSTAPAPAPALTAKSGGQWKLQLDTQSKATLPRSVDEPAPTVQFAHRANLATWVRERPATTVQGDPRVGRPGHKDRDKGEAQFEVDSVRITVQEAAILQSFPADYPWRGSKTAQFTQCGNAVPPLLAAHILAEATGLPLPAAERGDHVA